LFDGIGTSIKKMEASKGHKGTSTPNTEELPGEVPCWKSGSPREVPFRQGDFLKIEKGSSIILR